VRKNREIERKIYTSHVRPYEILELKEEKSKKNTFQKREISENEIFIMFIKYFLEGAR
jgi:hypothetical protein